MRLRTAVHTLAALSVAVTLLSACAGAPQSSTVGPPPIGASTTSAGARPNLNDAAYVKIVFRNKSHRRVEVQTRWRYPILPGWAPAEERCVDPKNEWTSEIGFQFPDAEAAIVVIHNDCQRRVFEDQGTIYFQNITFTSGEPERATIESDVVPYYPNSLMLCGHQSYPIHGEGHCTIIRRL